MDFSDVFTVNLTDTLIDIGHQFTRCHCPASRLQCPTNVHDLDSERAIVRTAVIRGAPLRDIRDIRLRRSQRLVLLTQRNDVLPDFIIFRHHLAPCIERFPAAIVNRSSRTVHQFVSALNVI